MPSSREIITSVSMHDKHGGRQPRILVNPGLTEKSQGVVRRQASERLYGYGLTRLVSGHVAVASICKTTRKATSK